jgi:hypothetical protein|tara:strand:- start:72 stop:263 length:192 start_codon:yes stop_codon:yes gene_type:complete
MTEKGAKDTGKKKKGEKSVEEREKITTEKEDEVLKWLYDMDNEMIRWMTEGTHPNNTPRSDCG